MSLTWVWKHRHENKNGMSVDCSDVFIECVFLLYGSWNRIVVIISKKTTNKYLMIGIFFISSGDSVRTIQIRSTDASN